MARTNTDLSEHNVDNTGAPALSLLKDFVVPTALITGIGAYIGWNMGAGYYAAFRLPIGFTAPPTPAFLIPASPELILSTLVIFLSYAINRYTQNHLQKSILINPKHTNKVILFSIMAIITSMILGTIMFLILLNLIEFNFTGINIVLLYGFVFTPTFLLIWTLSVIGNRIPRNIDSQSIKSTFSSKPLKVLFPKFNFYQLIFTLLVFLTINRIGYWRGYSLGIRDINNLERLPSVVIHSKDIYPFAYSFDAKSQLYTYQDIKLIDANKDFVIILKSTNPISSTNQTNNFRTYVITRKDTVILELGQ